MHADTIGLCIWCGRLDHQPLGADAGVHVEGFDELLGELSP